MARRGSGHRRRATAHKLAVLGCGTGSLRRHGTHSREMHFCIFVLAVVLLGWASTIEAGAPTPRPTTPLGPCLLPPGTNTSGDASASLRIVYDRAVRRCLVCTEVLPREAFGACLSTT